MKGHHLLLQPWVTSESFRRGSKQKAIAGAAAIASKVVGVAFESI
jgi:hypothetical protein